MIELKSKQDPIMEAVEGWSMNKSIVKLMDSIVSQLNLSSINVHVRLELLLQVGGWME